MLNDEYTGVESAPAAGEQAEQQDFSGALPAGETGVEEPAAAGQEREEGTGEERGFDEDRVEKAFARRLAHEREKIKRELEEELRRQFEAQRQQESLEERARKLADELMITPEAAKLILQQEERFKQQEERLKELATQYYMMRDDNDKVRVEAMVNERRKTNPYLPPFDEEKVLDVRMQYYNKYGVLPTWEDAYNLYVAAKLSTGEFGRVAEQQAIQKITGRNRVNVQVGKAAQPEKRDIWSLSDEEFERLKEEAKQGKLTQI